MRVGASQGSVAFLASGFGPRIVFDKPNEGGAGDPPPGNTEGAGADKGGGAASRPDWLGEQFWDADKGEIKGADFKAHIDGLTAFKAGEDSRRAAVPEKADAYELKLPADFSLGDGEKFELDANDPMLSFGRNVAHKLGLDQPGFEGLVGMYAQMRVAEDKEIQAAMTRQMEAMGPKARERQEAAKTFLTAKLGPDAPALFEPVLMLKGGVEAVERLIRHFSSGGGPGFSGSGREGGKAGPSEEEYAAMSPAEKLVAARKHASGGR